MAGKLLLLLVSILANVGYHFWLIEIIDKGTDATKLITTLITIMLVLMFFIALCIVFPPKSPGGLGWMDGDYDD